MDPTIAEINNNKKKLNMYPTTVISHPSSTKLQKSYANTAKKKRC
jgi:hypothetical protein